VQLNNKLLSGPGKHIPPHQRKLGFVFQDYALFPHLSVIDNVLCGLTVQGGWSMLGALLRPPQVRNRERHLRLRAMAALDRFGLTELADWPVDVLAYGDRKRVELARAVVGEPSLVLLDEPVAGLNHEETATVGQEIRALRAQGYTLLLVEHDMDLVMGVSDHVVVLDGGRCIASGTPDEIRQNPLVLEAYLGRTAAMA
jgi:branched-chain amino acid transport system ATP-binding protein